MIYGTHDESVLYIYTSISTLERGAAMNTYIYTTRLTRHPSLHLLDRRPIPIRESIACSLFSYSFIFFSHLASCFQSYNLALFVFIHFSMLEKCSLLTNLPCTDLPPQLQNLLIHKAVVLLHRQAFYTPHLHLQAISTPHLLLQAFPKHF